jgi:hypothetical protein
MVEHLPSPSVRLLPTDSGLVLLDTASNCLWAYNDTARQVWDGLTRGRRSGELAADLAAHWAIPADAARKDVGAILSHWRAQGLLAGGGPSASPAGPGHAKRTDWMRAAEPRWADALTCRIRDKVITLAVEPPGMASLLRYMLQHLEAPDAPADARLQVRRSGDACAVLVDGMERVCTADGGQIVGAVEQIILETIHPGTDWLALIHGGAIARNGVGFAVPGACGNGKTTLISYLVGRGDFTYLSDDLIALARPDGRIVPWPLPFNPKEGSWDLLTDVYPDLPNSPRYHNGRGYCRLIPAPAGSWEIAPVPLHGFIFPRYIAGSEAKLTRLTPFEALQRLLGDRIWLGYPITERRAGDFIAWLADKPAYALVHGGVAEAARLIETIA